MLILHDTVNLTKLSMQLFDFYAIFFASFRRLNTLLFQGDDEAISLLDSMKEATLLFQKAIYLEVLKITASEKTLTTYLSKGGWDLLNSWLSGNFRTLNFAPLIISLFLLPCLYGNCTYLLKSGCCLIEE